jgi:hypothetical protein
VLSPKPERQGGVVASASAGASAQVLPVMARALLYDSEERLSQTSHFPAPCIDRKMV